MEKCPELIAQLQNIKELQDKLNQKIEKYSDNRDQTVSIQIELLKNIYEARKRFINLLNEFKWDASSKYIRTNNVIIAEGKKQEKTIEFDFAEIVKKTKAFYERHGILLPPEFEAKATELWQENREAILREAATYGYDHILIIPDNLPAISELEKISMSGNQFFGSWNNINKKRVDNKSSKTNTFRLVLTHFVGELDKNPLLRSTIGESPFDMWGMSFATDKKASPSRLTFKIKKNLEEYNKRFGYIINHKGLLIKKSLDGMVCGSNDDNLTDMIEAEGLSLDEYFILQLQHRDQTGHYMDQKFWTCLLDSFSGDWCVAATLSGSRLNANEANPERQGINMGYRFSRSFSHFAPKKENTDNNKADLTWNTIPWRPA